MNRKLAKLVVFIIVLAMLMNAQTALFANVISPYQEVTDEEVNEGPEVLKESIDESDPSEQPGASEEPGELEEPDEQHDGVPEVEFEQEELAEGLMLDKMPATLHPSNPTAITKFAPGSLGSALTLKATSSMMSKTADLEPGEVRTSKTVIPVAGKVNTWDIAVRVEGRDADKIETTDVVLVIDRSGSMADNNRLTNAKTAVINFINNTIPADPNIRIAIVSFSSTYQGAQLVTVNRQFTRDIDQLTSSVNGLSALGGTHTQAGIIQGRALLTGSEADNKYLVLLSDGQPTYSYEPDNWDIEYRSGSLTDRDQYTAKYDGHYNENVIVGTGSDLTQSYNDSVGSGYNFRYIRKHINNGGAAIRAGVDARAGINGLFTIAVQAGTAGTPILEAIASPGMAYSTQNPEELQKIYDTIGTHIATQNALRNVVITDEMGDGFSLVAGTIEKTEGTTAVADSTDTKNQTITWTINPAVHTLVPGSSDVRYAEMTYRVEINPDILTASVATQGATAEHDLFKTNEVTTLKYRDINNTDQTKAITSPQVDPVLLKIKKILKDELGNVISSDPRVFNVKITNEGASFNHTAELTAGADYLWLTTLRDVGTYTVEEISIDGSGVTDLDQFVISYKIDGTEQTSFLVNHASDGTPRGNVVIDVTNQLTPQTVSVTVMKEVTGNLGDLSRKFAFTLFVNGNEENPVSFNLADGESETLENIPKNAVLTLFEETAGYGVTVMLGETEITPNQDGSYTLTLTGDDVTVNVTNNKDIVIDSGVLLDSLPYILMLVLVTISLGAMVIRKRRTASQD